MSKPNFQILEIDAGDVLFKYRDCGKFTESLTVLRHCNGIKRSF